MKTISFIGAYDKTDLLLYLAKIFTTMGKKVLIIDTTILQKAKYIVPVISPAKAYVTSYEDIDIAVGLYNYSSIKSYLGLPEHAVLTYDYIFIDCPPSLGMLTINSLTAVDSVLIPIQCEYYALEGVSQLMGTIKLVKSRLNPNLDIQGVVLSMFDGRANLSIQVVDEVKRYFKGSVYTTLIPRNVRLAEAPSHGKPVIYYDSKCKGAVAYMELAEEFIDLEEDII